MERPKTYAERQLERADAIQRLQEQLTGSGERPCSITAADIPDQVERPGPSKTFLYIGIVIVALLLLAQCISLMINSGTAKKSPPPEPVTAAEKE